MFVSTKRFGRNPKSITYDKPLPKVILRGSISERDVDPILDCFVNPKGSGAYKNFFLMTKEKEFVMDGVRYAAITPAQQELLELLKGEEAEWYAQKLRAVWRLGTFFLMDEESLDLEASCYVFYLLEAMDRLTMEQSQPFCVSKKN